MAQFGVNLWRAFLSVGIGPGLLGMVVLLRRNWRVGGLLLLMFAFSAGFYIDYRVVDKDTMFLPAYLVWALWLGVGFQWLVQWMREEVAGVANRRLSRLLYGLLVIVVLVAAAWNWQQVDLSDDWSARERAEAILRQVEPNALILGWWDSAPVVEYLQLVEGQRPDVKVINRFLISPDDMGRLVQRELPRRPVYIDSVPAELLRSVRSEPAGLIFRLRPNGQWLPQDHRLDQGSD
jgi:hypothetical protein